MKTFHDGRRGVSNPYQKPLYGWVLFQSKKNKRWLLWIAGMGLVVTPRTLCPFYFYYPRNIFDGICYLYNWYYNRQHKKWYQWYKRIQRHTLKLPI